MKAANLPVNPADDESWARDLAVIASETTAERLEAANADQTEGAPPWEIGKDGRLRFWLGQEEVAELLGVTPRHLRRLEELGLPSEGTHSTCRYPWPHAFVWYCEYQVRKEKVGAWLSMEDAFLGHDTRSRELDAQLEHRMRHESTFRREIRQIDRESAQSILAARRRLKQKATLQASA